MMKECLVLNKDRNVTLSIYPAETNESGPYPAVLIFPGGGYRICADIEAGPPALAYQKAGFNAFVLRYTTGSQCRWPLPLEDYEQAMDMIIDNAGEWNTDVNRIAIAGFSAGGHLAACAMTISKKRPAAAVLIYPALLPKSVDACLKGAPYPIEKVSDDNCPCFLAAARDDNTVDIRSTLTMLNALADHNIPFESHIYSIGGHAFSVGETPHHGHPLTPRLKNWVPESIGWLNETFASLTGAE